MNLKVCSHSFYTFAVTCNNLAVVANDFQVSRVFHLAPAQSKNHKKTFAAVQPMMPVDVTYV